MSSRSSVSSAIYLTPAEAARQLGISIKALRLYEQHGLLKPLRTAVGWRVYGPREMGCARDIVALRSLGFGLAQAAQVLMQGRAGLEETLEMHQAELQVVAGTLADRIATVRQARIALASGPEQSIANLAAAHHSEPRYNTVPAAVSFPLPWPWGGELFELSDIGALNYITGPLGSGKTRLARTIAAHLPGARFVDLDRIS